MKAALPYYFPFSCQRHINQIFHPKAIGNNACHAHVQCDSIIMDKASISSIPEINANHIDAQIIHEAAIVVLTTNS